MQPPFETQRLVFLPRTLMDTDVCLTMDCDPEVTRFVDGPWGDGRRHREFIETRTLIPSHRLRHADWKRPRHRLTTAK
jgi:hypothetical protein